MRQLFIILVFSSLKVNCQNSEKTTTINIIGIPNYNAEYTFKSGITFRKDILFEVLFDHQIEYIKLSEAKQQSSFVFNAKSDYVVLKHYINYFDFNEYIFMNGDTIEINYNFKPYIVKVINRNSLELDYTFEDSIRKQFFKNEINPIALYFDLNKFYDILIPTYSKNTPRITSEHIEKRNYQSELLGKRHVKPILFNYLSIYEKSIDSLKDKKISSFVYNYNKYKVSIFKALSNIESEQINEEEAKNILVQLDNTNLPFFDNYRHLIYNTILKKFIYSKLPFIDLKDGVNRAPDQVYTSIYKSQIFPEKDKNRLLKYEVHRAAEILSKEKFNKLFNSFSLNTNDIEGITEIKAAYPHLLSGLEITNSLELMDFQNNKTSLKNFLSENKNKVVYLDMWASWCGPCRAEFPYSESLRAYYKNKPVIFLYASIDKSFIAWKKAVVKEKLDNYPYNFLIANTDNSSFINENKINSIPRYLIFGKNGELVYANAAKPSNSIIRKKLNELIE